MDCMEVAFWKVHDQLRLTFSIKTTVYTLKTNMLVEIAGIAPTLPYSDKRKQLLKMKFLINEVTDRILVWNFFCGRF